MAETLSEILAKHTEKLMGTDGVVGIGEGINNGKPCIRVYLSQNDEMLKKMIPAELDGVPVCMEVSGLIGKHIENA